MFLITSWIDVSQCFPFFNGNTRLGDFCLKYGQTIARSITLNRLGISKKMRCGHYRCMLVHLKNIDTFSPSVDVIMYSVLISFLEGALYIFKFD